MNLLIYLTSNILMKLPIKKFLSYLLSPIFHYYLVWLFTFELFSFSSPVQHSLQAFHDNNSKTHRTAHECQRKWNLCKKISDENMYD